VTARAAACGTDSGYYRHVRSGGLACGACLAAHAAAGRARYRRAVRRPVRNWGEAVCGTDSGYSRHRYRGEPACAECLRARRESAGRRRRAAGKTYVGLPRLRRAPIRAVAPVSPLVEDAQWLDETGQGLGRLLEAARAAGRPLGRDGARAALKRAGRLDLWERLASRDQGRWGEAC
jgi:hypothetical protein